MRKESYEQISARLVELEKKYDKAIKQIREERKREHNLLKEVRLLLKNATVLLPQKSYMAVYTDDAGYIKDLKMLETIIEEVAVVPDVSGGYHKLVDNKIIIDEERKRLLEEMLD